ncbi:unnamed protein product [Urochloa humidicola]
MARWWSRRRCKWGVTDLILLAPGWRESGVGAERDVEEVDAWDGEWGMVEVSAQVEEEGGEEKKEDGFGPVAGELKGGKEFNLAGICGGWCCSFS